VKVSAEAAHRFLVAPHLLAPARSFEADLDVSVAQRVGGRGAAYGAFT
jgi:hypothetical protein